VIQTQGLPTGPKPGDGDLVRTARRGDLAAFEILVERYQRQATAVSYRLLNNREDAMDVVQDAFLRAFDKLDSLSQPGRFGPWLMRIVSNLSLNFRRSRALRKADTLDGVDDDAVHGRDNRPDPAGVKPPEQASANEVGKLLDEAIARLPETQRQALVLFAIEKLPQKEIAGMLGCSVEAVKWHVFTARKKLKEQFKDYL
jgi:RNA polymerase sigma-70 factor (ECF subfamily)